MSKENKEQSFEESLDELVNKKLRYNKDFIKHIQDKEKALLGSMEGLSYREKENRKKEPRLTVSRDNLYNNILSGKTEGLGNTIEQIFKAFDQLENKFQEEAQIIAINEKREVSLKNLNEEFKKIFNQYDENQAKQTRRNVEKKLYGTDNPTEIASKKVEARQAKTAKAAAAQQEENLRKLIEIQTKTNNEFIAEIKAKVELLNANNPDSIKEKKQQLYQDSLLNDEKNLTDLMVNNMKIFAELTNQYSQHQSSIEKSKNSSLEGLNKNFAKIFPDQHNDQQQKQTKQQAAANIYVKDLATKTMQTATPTELTGNKELDQTISEVVLRQANRQKLLRDAKDIKGDSRGGATINSRDFGINFVGDQKRLSEEIVNLKLDIYLLADLKSKTTKKDDYQIIDGLINNFTKNYEQAVYQVGEGNVLKERLMRPATGLQKDGESYNLIMNNSPERIARIIEQSPEYQERKLKTDFILFKININPKDQQHQKALEKAIKFNVDDFLKEAHPKVVLKIQAIQKELDKREQGQTSLITDNVDKFFNVIAKLVGGGVKNQDVINLHTAMSKEAQAGGISEGSMNKDNIHKHQVFNELKSILKKFTSTPEVKPVSRAEQKVQNWVQSQNGIRGK